MKIGGNCAVETYQKVRGERGFLFESKDISHIYGRLSLIGVDPVLEIRGKGDSFEILPLNKRAAGFMEELSDEDMSNFDEFERDDDGIRGKIIKGYEQFEEGERSKQKNISQVIRLFLEKFKVEGREFVGLYGAFSYDFVKLFENIPNLLPEDDVYDFRLMIYDTFIFFDHLKEIKEVIAYRESAEEALEVCEELKEKVESEVISDVEFAVEDDKFDLEQAEFEKLVENARDLAVRGELFEVVYSNRLRAKFKGDTFALYKKYADINPSPYLYYFNFGDEQLIGASPEMMVRCEHGEVHMRPISGTARRGEDPIEDHENMLTLLRSEKERAELDMLIDLGRNDLARICEPGIEISDYRFVEKYSKVMHTVAHLTGKLRKEFTAFDSLIACLNAGTLTGAPKVAAMTEIDKNEKSRRGYYGGTIGYLTFNGDMDTGIIIRTAHIKGNDMSFQVGATLLYDSKPEAEYQETLNKARAFLTTIAS